MKFDSSVFIQIAEYKKVISDTREKKMRLFDNCAGRQYV